ncbi:NifU N-terminal domain-containing protein, partial [Flavobacteriales bacterium]|nr:NifU N-terminal domain-containing protein [Flavobacteriales bacterium]
MNYSIYAESTPNPEVMKFVSNRMLADKSIEINSIQET